MNWSSQQVAALDAVGRWLRDKSSPCFRLFGYAGTGKTTLAKHLAQDAGGYVAFAAFTGKAAHVMRTHGCPNASTLHSLIYVPKDKSRRRLWDLEAELEGTTDHDERARLEGEIKMEKKNLERPAFALNTESDLRQASLLVIDECSMVDEEMALDVLSFGVPVLVLGDPAQLPPVRGAGYFTEARPDAMLTEIHRQAADNPIVRMATDVREGRGLRFGEYGSSRVARPQQVDYDSIDPLETQVIVGKNVTRRRANEFLRANVGLNGSLVAPGDKLVCLRNDHQVGILNGQLFRVLEAEETDWDTVDLEVREESSGFTARVEAHAAHFRGEEDQLEYWDRRSAQEFDYGYALTCHKSQGSQWPEVLVKDESCVFRQNSRRWLYTAVTRAAERVTVVR